MPNLLLLTLFLHLTVLTSLPLPPLPLHPSLHSLNLQPNPSSSISLLLTLPRFCRSTACITKALSQLTPCRTLHHHISLIRAVCPLTLLPTLLQTRRFAAIHPSPNLRLLSHRRAFHNITHLSLHSHLARTPAGHTLHLRAPHRVARCARARGAGVRVYVIDTGCRVTHEQLRGRATTLPAPRSRFPTGHDDHGHGTHVAATIAGRDFGLAPRATLVCIKALSHRNEGTGADVMAGIRHAIRVHPAGQPGIISISLGVRAPRRYRALDRAIADAASLGIVSVVAAGNSGRDACTFTPARAPSAMTVAAVGRDGLLADFSNWGRCVVVGAPGVRVWSAVAAGDRMYGVSSGTSMAAPFVSGLVALRMGERPRVSVEEIRKWLREISHDSQGVHVVSAGGFCRWMKRHRHR